MTTDKLPTELIPIEHFVCLRCGHKWIRRSIEIPRVCPGCHSAYWDKEKRNTGNGDGE